MSGTTTFQALPYPTGTDSPAGHTEMQALAVAVDGKLVMRFSTASARDAAITAPVEGMLAWLNDTNQYTYYTGTAWRQIADGELAYNDLTSPSSAFTAIADVTGLSISFTLAATRTIDVVAFCLVQSSVASDRIQLTLADGSNTQIQISGELFIPAANSTVPCWFGFRKSLAAGSYTYKIRGARAAGTGSCIVNAAANRPCFIQALDVT